MCKSGQIALDVAFWQLVCMNNLVESELQRDLPILTWKQENELISKLRCAARAARAFFTKNLLLSSYIFSASTARLTKS